MAKSDITILSVSFNSSIHLKRLIDNFLLKSSQKENIKFLIIDNTGGKDKSLSTLYDNLCNIRILKNKNRSKQRSISHASALDFGLGHVDTKFTLIVDPDIHIFYKNWDELCLKKMKGNHPTVLGAPYPQWKLGKVHDYPSVVFMFFKTNLIQSFGKTFHPFPKPYKMLYNSILRKFVRLGGVANKSRLGKSKKLRFFCGWLEKKTGVTAPDTGNEIIEQFQKNRFRTIVFSSPFEQHLNNIDKQELKLLAKDFEIYIYNDKPFLSHMYSSGVYHWRTKRSSDLKYWLSLIKKVENKIGKY